MKKLLVVRHAKSSWDNANIDDFDRPLNERGLRNAPEMARRLVLKGIKPDLILSSPANRAISTARFFSHQFGFKDDLIKTESSIYEASKSDLCRVVDRQNPDVNTIILVGHNPGLTNYVNWLCGSDVELATCAIAEIQVDDFKWNGWKKGSGILIDFDFPKKEFNERKTIF